MYIVLLLLLVVELKWNVKAGNIYIYSIYTQYEKNNNTQLYI